jgi:hypothetical protein
MRELRRTHRQLYATLCETFHLSGNYAFADETDNQLGINTLPSDSFVGIAPLVTETGTGRTNQNSSLFVPTEDLWRRPEHSSTVRIWIRDLRILSVAHTFQVNGLLELPWQFQVSGIFRAQSGFHFSRKRLALEDPDGDGTFNGIDHGRCRTKCVYESGFRQSRSAI